MTAAEYDRVPRVMTADYDSPAAASLEAIWATKPGLYGLISTVDHKEIGIRYLATAFVFLIVGGLEALAIRLQLARPNQALVTPEQYNELFSAHAITMIFLYAQPVLSGFSNYLFPLVLGCARHGVSTTERLLLLGLPRGGPLHVRKPVRRRRSE